jgi:Flp pilus assembly pilin Flp
MSKLKQFLNDETGAVAAEYAILLVFIALVIVTGAQMLGLQINIALEWAALVIKTGMADVFAGTTFTLPAIPLM